MVVWLINERNICYTIACFISKCKCPHTVHMSQIQYIEEYLCMNLVVYDKKFLFYGFNLKIIKLRCGKAQESVWHLYFYPVQYTFFWKRKFSWFSIIHKNSYIWVNSRKWLQTYIVKIFIFSIVGCGKQDDGLSS